MNIKTFKFVRKKMKKRMIFKNEKKVKNEISIFQFMQFSLDKSVCYWGHDLLYV